MKASQKERRFMAAMLPDGTVATGSVIGHNLHRRGLIEQVRWGRYGLTEAGRQLMLNAPEAGWNLPSDASLKGRRR